VFKPAGIPFRQLEKVVMTLDEFEAIRLADLDSLYHEQAAARMGISRATFSRIVDSAHAKVADVLAHGKALHIEGGPVLLGARRCCRMHDAEEPLPGTAPDDDGPDTPTAKGRTR
jgi:uncharacterized protein